MENTTKDVAEGILRSLITEDEFERYLKTKLFSTGNGTFNRMISDVFTRGYLTPEQHEKLKKRLQSCEMNVHLDDLPGAKRHGRFVLLPGGA